MRVKALSATVASVVIIGSAVVGIIRWLSAERPPQYISVEQQFSDSGVYLVEGTVERLGEPPAYEPDVGVQEAHCDEWHAWLQRKNAIGFHDPVNVEVRATVAAPITITHIRPIVYRRRPIKETTIVRCEYGAGVGEPGTAGELNLDHPTEPVLISPSGPDSLEPFPLPPGRFVVSGGEAETLELYPISRGGSITEFGIELTYVIDGRPTLEVHGTAGSPFRAVSADDFSGYEVDWNPYTRRWGQGPFNVASAEPARQYCGTVHNRLVNAMVAVSVESSDVLCYEALKLVDRYYNNPPAPAGGSGGFLQLESWSCISTSGTEFEQTGKAGTCSGPRGTIRMARP